MKQQKKILSFLSLFGFCIAIVQGHKTIPSTGGVTKLVFESPDFENLRFRLFDVNRVLLKDKS
jgi:hypothetical protein